MTREEVAAFHKAYPNRQAVIAADTAVAKLPGSTTLDEEVRLWLATYEAVATKGSE